MGNFSTNCTLNRPWQFLDTGLEVPTHRALASSRLNLNERVSIDNADTRRVAWLAAVSLFSSIEILTFKRLDANSSNSLGISIIRTVASVSNSMACTF